ncbi:MAG: 5-(carboxyamino)imidazole ribonucleotide mutase [Acholeplasmataceae bacterium]|nr:5-(carboxyamino)imidazole ribonucleotide mutase [Acholeplasmataceae bacterium]
MLSKIAIIMGSQSDYATMKETEMILESFGVSYETKIVSAHRTPDFMFEFAENAEKRGFEIIIAGAGGAAHLPGMVASKTILPVLGVPIQSKELNGIDSLLSIAQMPAGIPVGTLAIGVPGAKNAALLACQILALKDETLKEKLHTFRKNQTEKVLKDVI